MCCACDTRKASAEGHRRENTACTERCHPQRAELPLYFRALWPHHQLLTSQSHHTTTLESGDEDGWSSMSCLLPSTHKPSTGEQGEEPVAPWLPSLPSSERLEAKGILRARPKCQGAAREGTQGHFVWPGWVGSRGPGDPGDHILCYVFGRGTRLLLSCQRHLWDGLNAVSSQAWGTAGVSPKGGGRFLLPTLPGPSGWLSEPSPAWWCRLSAATGVKLPRTTGGNCSEPEVHP